MDYIMYKQVHYLKGRGKYFSKKTLKDPKIAVARSSIRLLTLEVLCSAGGGAHQQDDRHGAVQRAHLQPRLAPRQPPLLLGQRRPQEVPPNQQGELTIM